MDKERYQRVGEWNEFRKRFHSICEQNLHLIELINKQLIYLSSDTDDPKKSQLILAFSERPINTYRDNKGSLKVESQWGCRLFFSLEYNGTITSYIKDYSDTKYTLKTYESAKCISNREFDQSINTFLLVEKNTSKVTLPTALEKIKFFWFINIGQKTKFEIFMTAVSKFPIVSKLFKALPTTNENDSHNK